MTTDGFTLEVVESLSSQSGAADLVSIFDELGGRMGRRVEESPVQSSTRMAAGIQGEDQSQDFSLSVQLL